MINTTILTHKSTTSKVLTCQFCHHTGPDVQSAYWWIGGQGDVLLTTCDDGDACNARQDALENQRREYAESLKEVANVSK